MYCIGDAESTLDPREKTVPLDYADDTDFR